MKAQLFHNTTTVADLAADGDAEAIEDLARDPRNGRGLAIFRRFGHDDSAPIKPGDRLLLVGTLDFPDLTQPDWSGKDAANAAFAAGNAPGGPNVQEYRSWQVRSLSTGDVVVADGRAFACASFGWEEIDPALTDYTVTERVTQ